MDLVLYISYKKYKTCLGYVPTALGLYCTAVLWTASVPILLSKIEQEQRPSGKGDSEAIVVGAGLCDGEGERVFTAYGPHYNILLQNTSENTNPKTHMRIKYQKNGCESILKI